MTTRGGSRGATGTRSDDTVLGPLAEDLADAALALARSFAAGATLWCVAPEWPEHARHVAVEFVHPVIVGKRALAAVAVERDAVGALRVGVRPGDVVVAVAAASDEIVADLVQRAAAWGVSTMWIGAGTRPMSGAADHVLFVDDPDPLAARRGRLTLVYHLLWELTHVCLEHPGLLPGAPEPTAGEVCITCADEGRTAEVATALEGGRATVRIGAAVEEVDTTLVGAVATGDLLLVHAGTAISRLGEA